MSGPAGFSSLCDAGSFDTTTGQYTFSTSDNETYPPGTYEITIVGTLGTKTASTTIEVIIEDPCLTAELSLATGIFPASTDYVLRTPEKSIPWD